MLLFIFVKPLIVLKTWLKPIHCYKVVGQCNLSLIEEFLHKPSAIHEIGESYMKSFSMIMMSTHIYLRRPYDTLFDFVLIFIILFVFMFIFAEGHTINMGKQSCLKKRCRVKSIPILGKRQRQTCYSVLFTDIQEIFYSRKFKSRLRHDASLQYVRGL